MAGKFRFKDYTVDESGRDIVVKGIPFKVKQQLTLGERQKASDASVKIGFDEKGQPKLQGVDQSALLVKIATMAILEWPFEEDSGKPTPIDEVHIRQLDPDLLDAIFAEVMKTTKVPDLNPFEKASDVQ